MKMNDRTRFIKAYIMTTEKGPKWVAKFVTDRLRIRHQAMPVDMYIKKLIEAKILSEYDPVVKRVLAKEYFSAEQLDISALAKLFINTKSPSIIDKHERRTASYGSNNVGDLVERIVQRRNNLVHTPNAELSADEYNDVYEAMIEIGSNFEGKNHVSTAGDYCKEIDDVHNMILDNTEETNALERYRVYVEIIINTEIRLPPSMPSVTPTTPETSGSAAEEMARHSTTEIDNPIGKVLVGGVAGTIGLGFDVITAPKRVFDSIFRRN